MDAAITVVMVSAVVGVGFVYIGRIFERIYIGKSYNVQLEDAPKVSEPIPVQGYQEPWGRKFRK